jgi:type IV pilus assembly protein PilM
MLKQGIGKKSLVGLDIGSSSIKAVELQGKPGTLKLVNLGYENLPPDSIVDGQIMELNNVSHVISNIFKEQNIKTDKVAASVSGHSVIVKNIVVPQMSEEELRESIDWHAEEHIPFDITDVSLDYQVTDAAPDALHVLLAACKRDKVSNIKQAIQLAGKQPTVIDVDAFALQNCYEVNYQPTPGEIVALLNIGASTMNINILNGTKSVFTRDVTVGGNQFTSHLQKEMNLNFEQAEKVKRGVPLSDVKESQDTGALLQTALSAFSVEIKKTFDFYSSTSSGDAPVQKILLSGGGSKLAGLREFLAEQFEMPVEVLDPFRHISVDTKQFDPDYMREVMPEMAVAVGLALRGVDAR